MGLFGPELSISKKGGVGRGKEIILNSSQFAGVLALKVQ